MSVSAAPWFNYMQCNTGEALRPRRSFLEVAMFTSFILSKVKAYLKYRETLRELSRLSDRELEDIGVARYQIDDIARVANAA